MQTLSETQRRIFTEMPLDHAVTVDALTRLGFGMGEVMAALTVLEPLGLAALLAVCTAYLVDGSFNPFLYFRF